MKSLLFRGEVINNCFGSVEMKGERVGDLRSWWEKVVYGRDEVLRMI
jgi:hypothetical protein